MDSFFYDNFNNSFNNGSEYNHPNFCLGNFNDFESQSFYSNENCNRSDSSDKKELEDEAYYKRFGNPENVGIYNNSDIAENDEKNNMKILSKNDNALEKTTKANTAKKTVNKDILTLKVHEDIKTKVEGGKNETCENILRVPENKFGGKKILKPKTVIDIRKYIGDAKGYTKNDTNDLLYSILCQIKQDDFDKIVEYVNGYDQLFQDIAKKLKVIGTNDFFVFNLYNMLNTLPETFLEAVDKSRIASGNKYSKHANYIRAGILLKQIEIKLNCEKNDSDSFDLSELIKDKTVIEFSRDEANDFISALGKNAMVCKFNKMGNYKTYGAVTISNFSIEAIAKLLSKPVFVYVTKSVKNPEALGFIFKNPDLNNNSDLLPPDGGFSCKKIADNDLKKINSFIEKSIGFWEKEYDIKNNTISFCFISNRDSDYTVPLGLDENGEKYTDSSIKKHISKKIQERNKNKQDNICWPKQNLNLEDKSKQSSSLLSSLNKKNKKEFINRKHKSTEFSSGNSIAINNALDAYFKISEAADRKKFISIISGCNKKNIKPATNKYNDSMIDLNEE